jgi:hypothetical protein
MVLRNQTIDCLRVSSLLYLVKKGRRTISLDDFTFRLCHIVDPTSVDLVPRSEKTLPSSHRVRANYWTSGLWLATFSIMNEQNTHTERQ